MLSGDSTVEKFSFDGQEVVFLYEDNETEKTFRVKVETPMVYSEISGGRDCVHLRLEDSTDKLVIDENSGLFILPGEFSKQMASINKGHHVLAGLKAAEYKKILILQGYGRILVCPIKDEKSISIEETT